MASGSRFGLINFPVPTNLTDFKGLTHMQMGIWAIIVIFVFYSFYKMFSSSSFGGPDDVREERERERIQAELILQKRNCEQIRKRWDNKRKKCVQKCKLRSS